MKIRDIITERQQQRTEIMYHGTSSKLVPAILKHGLLATPPKKTYDAATYGAGSASMGGVYVAANIEFANSIAQEAVGSHGGDPAIITIQYVKGSADIDEDHILAAISDATKSVMRDLGNKAPNKSTIIPRDFGTDQEKSADPYSKLSYPDQGWAVDRMISEADRAAERIAAHTVQRLSKRSKPSQAAHAIIKQIAMKLLKHAGQYNRAIDRWHSISAEAANIIRENMEELLAKLMRQVSPDTKDGGTAARRIDRDVKFTGKTKILKIEIGNNQVYPR